MNAPTAADFWALLPVILLSVGALVVLLVDLVLRAGPARSAALFGLSVAFVVAALGVSVWQCSAGTDILVSPALASQWTSRPFTLIAAVLLEVIVLLVLLAMAPWMRAEDKLHEGEAYTLLLLFPVGAILMVAGRDLMVVFIGLEILSLSLYVLTAMRRTRLAAVEAGMKYFLLGAFASGFFVYGAALLYGGNGNLTLPELGPVSRAGLPAPAGLAAIGGGLVFVALFFKASLAPFHMWTPDVYEGAGTPVTALMSTGTKAAAFVVMIAVAPWLPRQLVGVVPVLALVTMLVGNVGAIAQTNVKRMIAYSGIAHAGYLMVGYTALAKGTAVVDAGVAIRAMLFYLATYAVTNLGALAVVAYLERRDARAVDVDGLRGVAAKHPVAAACLALCVLSLGGIPPTAGFWGKYQLFAAAVHVDEIGLAVVGVMLSAVGLYYYLRIVVVMYMRERVEGEGEWGERGEGVESEGVEGRGSPLAVLAMAVPSVCVLVFGVFPGVLMEALVLVRM